MWPFGDYRPSKKAVAGAAAAAIAIATPFVATKEGVRYLVYRDVVGVRTYCYGETENPQPGHRYTPQECTALLRDRVAEFDAGVRGCVKIALTPKTEAAFTSLAYNIGTGAFCSSTVARLANAGRLREACEFMSRYNRAGGRVISGLTVRRGQERQLCLEGLL